MSRTAIILPPAAIGVIVGLGILAHHSPEFKNAGTIAGIVLLGLLALIGLLGAVLAPLLNARTTGPNAAAETLDGHSLVSHIGSMR